MTDSFGDPQLVSPDLLPAPQESRVLGNGWLAMVWAAAVLSPGAYGFAWLQKSLPVAVALAAFTAASVIAAGTIWATTRTAVRYGIPLAVQARLAFGPRGSTLIGLLCWGVGVVFAAAWALETAVWSRRLLLFFSQSRGIDRGPWIDALGWHLPWRGGVALASWLVAGLLVLLGWAVAAGGVRRVGRAAVLGLTVTALAGAVLVVMAGMRSRDFGPWLDRATPWGWVDLAAGTGLALALLVPAIIAGSSWLRYQKRPKGISGVLGMVVGAPLLVGVGALLASAAHGVLDRIAGHPIADAAGFGQLLGAGIGVALALGMWLAAAPLCGFYAPAQALAGLGPTWVGSRGGVRITTGAIVLAVPLVAFGEERGLHWVGLAAAMAPVIAILAVDEWLLRRRQLLLEDAYLLRGEYSPTLGFTLTALAALGIGWTFHPWALLAWAPLAGRSIAALQPLVGSPILAVAGTAAGALLAAALYAAGSPLERRIGGRLKQVWARRRGARRAAKAEAQWSELGAKTSEETTNPHFVYDRAGVDEASGAAAEDDSHSLPTQKMDEAAAQAAVASAAATNSDGGSGGDGPEVMVGPPGVPGAEPDPSLEEPEPRLEEPDPLADVPAVEIDEVWDDDEGWD